MVEKAIKYVEKIKDKLGKPVDIGIKEAIITFKLLNIHTTASCQGHIDWGIAAPWIDISSKDDYLLRQKRIEMKTKGNTSESELAILMQEIQDKNLKAREKVFTYLTEFYKERQVPFDRMLTITNNRLKSQGADYQKLQDVAIKRVKLIEYQEEMNVFVDFLKLTHL